METDEEHVKDSTPTPTVENREDQDKNVVPLTVPDPDPTIHQFTPPKFMAIKTSTPAKIAVSVTASVPTSSPTVNPTSSPVPAPAIVEFQTESESEIETSPIGSLESITLPSETIEPMTAVTRPSAFVTSWDGEYAEITDDTAYNAFPSMVKLVDDSLIVVYRKGTSHADDKGSIVMKSSRDLGKTWSVEEQIQSDQSYDLRDPNITALSDGQLIISYFLSDQDRFVPLRDSIRLALSSDGGFSWKTAGEVHSGFDDWSAVSSPVIELPDGALLLAIYGRSRDDNRDSSIVVMSRDGRLTWGDRFLIADGPTDDRNYQEPNLVALEDGRLVAMMRSDGETETAIYSAISSNAGVDWSLPVKSFKGSGSPRIIQLNSGVLVASYRAITIGSSYRLALKMSSDGGVTWKPGLFEYFIDEEALPMMYSSVVELEAGLGVAYGMENGSDNSEIRYRYIARDTWMTMTFGCRPSLNGRRAPWNRRETSRWSAPGFTYVGGCRNCQA